MELLIIPGIISFFVILWIMACLYTTQKFAYKCWKELRKLNDQMFKLQTYLLNKDRDEYNKPHN